MTADEGLLKGKRIITVDDEPDVLETLNELLPMCEVEKAFSFGEGKKLLETKYFDMAILDIMGIDGYKLLEIANKRNVIAVILTAHALSPDNIVKSYKEGAASYIPKDEMANITVFLNDILEAKEAGKNSWWRWLVRLSMSYWEEKFGPDWEKEHEAFWKHFPFI